jgi:hypothetical protein
MSFSPKPRLVPNLRKGSHTMTTETFIRELSRDRRLAGHAVKLAEALEAMDMEGDDVPDAKALFSAIEWVIAQPGTIEKRLEVISRLLALGKVEYLNMREFYGLQ